MLPYDDSMDAAREVFAIAELVELVVLNLDYDDILRAEDTSTFIRGVIRNSPKLLRRMHKTFTQAVIGDDDPHFEPPSVAAQNALIGHGVNAGKPVVLEAKQAVKNFLENTHAAGHDGLHSFSEQFDSLCWRYRYGCRSIRNWTSGWPPGYRETFCTICNGFHTKFCFENIHPLLRLLDEMQLCFRGSGLRLLFTPRVLYNNKAPRACIEHVCSDFISLAKLSRHAHEQMSRRKLQDDQFTRPACTLLFRDIGNFIVNDNGVTLNDALVLMIRALKAAIKRAKTWIHEPLDRDNRPAFRDWEDERFGMQVEHERVIGSAEAWKDYVADFPNIVKMFDRAVDEVGFIFEGAAPEDRRG